MTQATLVTDPVCGMTIDPANAAGSSAFRGATYFFCNPRCKATFDASPEKYADVSYAAAEGGCCTTGHSCC